MFNNSYNILKPLVTERKVMELCYFCFVTICDESSTVELHLSGLIGTERRPDRQKIRIIIFLFQIGHNGGIYSMHFSHTTYYTAVPTGEMDRA
jgi:hypothetical protein